MPRYEKRELEKYKKMYLLTDGAIGIAIDDILSLNALLNEAHDNCTSFPKVRIVKDNINFTKTAKSEDEIDFCWVEFMSKTPSGKQAKFQQCLHFFAGKNLFGDIYYLQNATIGKAWICSWHGEKCFEIKCALKQNALSVIAIDRTLLTPEYSKEKLYRL